MKNTNQKKFSKIGLSYLTLGLTTIITEILIFNIISPHIPQIITNQNLTIIISAICSYILPLPLFLHLLHKINPATIIKKNLNIKKFLICFCITMFLMYLGNIIGLTITDLISNLKQTTIPNPVIELIYNSNIWINIFLITLIGPIFEELFFRKFLIDRTIQFGPKISILTSGLLFGLFHGNLNQFFYAFLMGSFFALIYTKTGQIKYTITLHILVNFLGSVVSIFMLNATNSNITLEISLATIFSIAIFIIVLLGSIFTITNYKKFTKLQDYIPHPIKTSILNGGMIAFITFYIIEITLTTI